MTGYKLTSMFYFVNLDYLKNNPDSSDPRRAHLVLFLLGLIETVHIKDPDNIHPTISTFLNAN